MSRLPPPPPGQSPPSSNVGAAVNPGAARTRRPASGLSAVMPTIRAGRIRQAPTSVLGLLWWVTFGAIRDFVWGDLRSGMLSLRGLSRGTRTLVWLGFGLLALILTVLVTNDSLRQQLPLTALPNAVVGRGSVLPVVLVPTTLFLVTIAWTFALTGALHGHPAVRIGMLLLYVATAIGWN